MISIRAVSKIGMRIFFCLSSVLAVNDSLGKEARERPNIVIILADDFGIGDIQAHFPENKIATPHLDAFSAESMRFTNAHSGSAVCTPTRYGLLTGRYAWRTRLQEWVLACYEPPLIAADRLTLPGFLAENGYDTACIGKWHLGWNWAGPQPNEMQEMRNILRTRQWDYTKPVQNGPTTRGFDYYFGTDVPNQPPFTFIENDRVLIQPTSAFEYVPNDGRALPRQFDGNPMAPGWRFDQILPELTKRAVEYIHDHANQEEPFFLYFPMTSPHTPIVPTERFRGQSGISLVADFIMDTDWSAGQVIKALEDAGVAEDTLVIFTSDNGHLPTDWDKLVNAGHFPSGPYRGRKADIWEGGHRVPFLIRWPGRIEKGSVNDDILSLNDVFATCVELLDGELPSNSAEDSFSFLATVLGKTDRPHRDHVVSHSVGGEFAYMEGPWKVVFKNGGANPDQSRGKPRTVELYHLDTDIAEKTNRVKEEPEIAKRLSEKLRAIVDRGASRAGAIGSNDAEVNIDVMQTLRWAPSVVGSAVSAGETGFQLDVDSDEILEIPRLSEGRPAAGKRVNMVAPEYKGTEVYHTLFLPENWSENGERLPIIFEYTGNYFPASGSTGEVDGAGLGFGLSGGKYIWVSLPYIAANLKENQVTWWGDERATVDYAKVNVPRIIREYHAEPHAVFLCGFSRGAIGVNYLGLYDEEIARLWSAFITHDHFDGIKEWKNTDWGTPLEKYRKGAVERLKRVGGRPYLVSQNGERYGTEAFIRSVLPKVDHFTVSNIDTNRIFGSFPHPIAKHPHTDRWLFVPSEYRPITWKWMNEVVERSESR